MNNICIWCHEKFETEDDNRLLCSQKCTDEFSEYCNNPEMDVFDMEIIKARKKPVVVEAIQLTIKNKDQVFFWITCNTSPIFLEGKPAIKIQTLEGDMIASVGDWIIKGVNGEFYPCKPDIFKKTYDIVE